ncbi:MAG: hypothetical protein KDM91_20985 [Verrucomicrobiae bacterium]|nr:hypothetical protein [Verrucomicrobiae bacterium]MCP5542237.1 hypothetical protein [Akkermansiaceae bacterium]
MATDDTDSKESWRSVLEKARTLTGFTEEDEQILQEASEVLRPCSEEIAQVFYDTLYGFAPTAAIFRDLDQDRSVRESTLRQWFESLVSGQYDDRFWTWHWLVGLVHVQHHVEHVFVMSMIGRVQTVLVGKAFEIFEEASAERVIQAFIRVTNCLAALTVEAYHHEYLHAVRESGMKEPVLNRMVSMEVKKKIEQYRRILGPYPIH